MSSASDGSSRNDLALGTPPERALRGLEESTALDGAAGALDRVSAPVGRGPVGAMLRGEWLGHALHPPLTDLALGCWTSAQILDLTAFLRGGRAAQRLVGAGVLFAAPTALSGLAEYGSITEPRARRVAVVHAAGNGVAVLLYLASWRARRRGHHIRGAVESTLGGVLAMGAGYLGGHLAFALGVGAGRHGRVPAPG